MDFDTFITRAWDDHAGDPHAVAGRIDADGRPRVTDEDQFIRLADLVHHLYGDHLADRLQGLARLEAMTAMPPYRREGASGDALRRFSASLRLSAGEAAALEGFAASDRIRILALATSNVDSHDLPRAAALFREAVAMAQQARLPAEDPSHGDLALSAHNLAAGLGREADLPASSLALMLLAAQTARHHWGLSGSPEDVTQGEYRLAQAWRRYGDLERARGSALRCLALAAVHGDPALECFLGWQALALVDRALHDRAGFERAAGQARAAFAALDAAAQARHAAKLKELA